MNIPVQSPLSSQSPFEPMTITVPSHSPESVTLPFTMPKSGVARVGGEQPRLRRLYGRVRLVAGDGDGGHRAEQAGKRRDAG